MEKENTSIKFKRIFSDEYEFLMSSYIILRIALDQYPEWECQNRFKDGQKLLDTRDILDLLLDALSDIFKFEKVKDYEKYYLEFKNNTDLWENMEKEYGEKTEN